MISKDSSWIKRVKSKESRVTSTTGNQRCTEFLKKEIIRPSQNSKASERMLRSNSRQPKPSWTRLKLISKLRKPPRKQEILQLKLLDKLLISSKDQERESHNSTRSMEDSKKQKTISKVILTILRSSRDREMKKLLIIRLQLMQLKEKPMD